jgi:hypothetical protein
MQGIVKIETHGTMKNRKKTLHGFPTHTPENPPKGNIS